MKKNRIVRVLRVPLWAALLLLFAACAAVKPAQQAERDFYKEHSQKLGVQLKGNEHKGLLRVSAQWLGTPYKYGGTSQRGIDCSAFVGVVYKDALGITLPRNSSAIAKSVTNVQRNSLQCGDIVFFTNKEKRISHVGIYLSDNKFIHASTSKGVSVTSLSNSYWNSYYAGAGRVKGAVTVLPAKSQAPPPPAKTPAPEKPAVEKPAPEKPAVEKPATEKTVLEKPAVEKTAPEKPATGDLIIVFDEDF